MIVSFKLLSNCKLHNVQDTFFVICVKKELFCLVEISEK